MTLTPKRRACLMALSDGEWHDLRHHAAATISWLNRAGLIRDNMSWHYTLQSRLWTITQCGIEALEASQ